MSPARNADQRAVERPRALERELLAREREPMPAQVVGAALEQRDSRRAAERGGDQRQIFREELVPVLERARNTFGHAQLLPAETKVRQRALQGPFGAENLLEIEHLAGDGARACAAWRTGGPMFAYRPATGWRSGKCKGRKAEGGRYTCYPFLAPPSGCKRIIKHGNGPAPADSARTLEPPGGRVGGVRPPADAGAC